jgi:hypothetical protein
MRVTLGCLSAILLIFLTWAAPGMAQPPYPEEFPPEFPQVEGCEMAQVMNMKNNISAMLTCAQTPKQKVYDFYLSKAKEAGWDVLMENKTADFNMFMAEKGKTAFQVTAAEENGVTQAGLSLISKGD